MGYVPVKGGKDAIENSIQFLEFKRNDGSKDPIRIEQIMSELHFLVDRVVSEASLYAPHLAAVAIKQAQGDVLEASFILRAYRSTLPRIGYTETLQTESMRLIRRISSAFMDLPGGQYLGPSPDYSLRILNFDLVYEKKEEIRDRYLKWIWSIPPVEKIESTRFPKLVEILKRENLIASGPEKYKAEIFDITKRSVSFPCQRSALLQALSRGEQGGMLLLAYSNVRGYGTAHPTVAELRVGYVRLEMKHPFKEKVLTIGEILLTETEVVSKITESEGKARFQLGYGLCFGHNETKALSMAILDLATKVSHPKYPSEDQEFVMLHIDGVESMGFVNHFKLPHYVTFLSDLDRLRRILKAERSDSSGDETS